MKVGDRVEMNPNYSEDEGWPMLGTVMKVSPTGYVSVEWDSNVVVPPSMHSPRTAQQMLRVVTGEEAKPQHDWELKVGANPKPYNVANYQCTMCYEQLTDGNYLEKCNPVRQPVA